MIAIDSNILIYAFIEESPFFSKAKQVLQSLIESDDYWAIAWPSIHEFISIVTNPKIYKQPVSSEKAIKHLDALFSCNNFNLLDHAPTHWTQLKNLILNGNISGGMIHDAKIFAICLEHGVKELWTADRDFSRFKGLKIVNPLI